MLIGIEASRANRLQKTGVEWYAYHLIQEMKKLPDAARHSFLLYSNEPLAMGLETGPSNWHEARLPWPPKYLWTQARLTWEMMHKPPEVLFVPAHVLPRVIPKRSVVTVHDVGFRRHPELYKPHQCAYHEASTRDIVKRASKIITVSAFTKRELVECYAADPSRIFVTHLGIDHGRFHPVPSEERARILSRSQIPEPFLLFVGRLEKKKNVPVLLEAFHRYKTARGLGDPLHLVLVGQPGAGYAELERQIQDHPSHAFIRIVGYVGEEEKAALLSSALALVHPAWYEGFGIPPLEAMASGAPVLCSNAASLPEIVGDENALWFDPQDPEGLARLIARLVDDPAERARLRTNGLAWSERYRWSETARQTLSILTTW